METPERGEVQFKPWGEVTDPRKHNPSNFRYLVYGINPFAQMIPLMFLKDEKLKRDDREQTVLFREPERVAEKRHNLSCSLIDQDHQATWGPAGLIVEASAENILVASSTDVKSTGRIIKRPADRLEAGDVLSKTSPDLHNEIVISTESGIGVRLAGFFIKIGDDGLPINEFLAKRIRERSRRLGQPLITLHEPNPYAKDRIIEANGELSVDLNGKRYFLEVKQSFLKFRGVDQKGISTFASPAEIKSILKFLRKQSVNRTKIIEIAKNYGRIDELRQKPKVRYNERGEIDHIEKVMGYGNSEEIWRITREGITSWDYMANEIRKMQERLIDLPGSPVIEQGVGLLNLLSLGEVREVVREVLRNVSDEEKEKIKAWYESIRPVVKKRWRNNLRRSEKTFGFASAVYDPYRNRRK